MGKKFTGKTPGDGPNIKLISAELDSIDPKLNFTQSPNLLRSIEIYGQMQEGIDYEITEYPPNTSLLDITFYIDPNSPKPRVIPSSQMTIPTEKRL